MSPERQREVCREAVSDLNRRIEKLKQLSDASVPNSREFWRSQIEMLEEQRNEFEDILRGACVFKSLDLPGR